MKSPSVAPFFTVLVKLRGDETAEGLKKTAADLVFAPTPAACEVCS